MDLKVRGVNGLGVTKVKPKRKMWKMQARTIAKTITCNNGLIIKKRLKESIGNASP